MPIRKMEKGTCQNKMAYDSEKDANKAKNCVKKHSKRSIIPKRSYYCKDCRKWHLTSLKNKNENFND